MEYLNHCLFLNKFAYPFQIPNIIEAKGIEYILISVVKKVVRKLKIGYKRKGVYMMCKEVVVGSRGEMLSLETVFSKNHFWKKGVFL